MARTKRTPRKRVGGGIVPLPGTISWALQKPEVMIGDGLRFEMPWLLWAVLRELKYVEPPMYTGTRHPLGDRGYTWKVKVTVVKASRDGEDRVVQREHEAIAPWTTYEGGCQDAARQALQVICAKYHRRLEYTEYVYLPYRLSVTLRIEADMVEPTADPVLKVMRDTLKLQTHRLDAAHDEIAYLNRRLDQQRREYMELEKTLQYDGDDIENVEFKFNLRPKPRLCSPSRKKLHRAHYPTETSEEEEESEQNEGHEEEESESEENPAEEKPAEEENPATDEEEPMEEEEPEEEEPMEEEEPEEEDTTSERVIGVDHGKH